MHLKFRRPRSRAWLTALMALLAGLLSVAPLSGTPRAEASYGNSIHMGWDACGASISKARAFWTNTPYWNIGLYLGGSDYGSDCKRWTNSEVGQLRSMGYKLLPLWVGPQAPCSNESNRFSYDPATASSQGTNEAVAIYNKIVSLGWDTSNAPIIYDLEAFNTTNGSCMNAAKSFINGWVHQMHVAPVQKAGVYGSSCASGLSRYAGLANMPDFIDGADWDGYKNTSIISCIPSTYWVKRQRHKQYRGGHNETWNGVTMNIDSDCSNGPVCPGPDSLTNPQGCA